MTSKTRLLTFVREWGSVRSAEVAEALGYTVPGAASMLLRLHRHGHLRRQLLGRAYSYGLSHKGASYLLFRVARSKREPELHRRRTWEENQPEKDV